MVFTGKFTAVGGTSMSEYAEKHRRERKEKAHRLADAGSPGKVDATTVSRPEAFTSDKKTWPHEPKRRAFRSGGKVEGEASHAHAGKLARTGNRKPEGLALPGPAAHPEGRMARKSGGRTKGKTNINIVIGQPHGAQPAAAAPPPPVPAPMPHPAPMPVPPPMPGGLGGAGAGAPMPPMPMPGGAGAPPMPGMMPRRRGGRTMAKGC